MRCGVVSIGLESTGLNWNPHQVPLWASAHPWEECGGHAFCWPCLFCQLCSSVDQQDCPRAAGNGQSLLFTDPADHGPRLWGECLCPAVRANRSMPCGFLTGLLEHQRQCPQPFPEEALHFKLLLIPVKVLLNVIKITKVAACNFNVLYQPILQEKSPGASHWSFK